MHSGTKSPIDLPSSSGGFVIREGLRFVFFMRQPHRSIAPAVVEAISQILDLFPPPALSMLAAESGDWIDYDARDLKLEVRKRLTGKSSPINGSISLSGDQANIPDVRVKYEGSAIDLPIFSESAPVLSFFLASTMCEHYGDRPMQLACDLAQMLGCSSAYIDLALEGDQMRAQGIARRYRNLDISNVGCVAEDIGDKCAGVFWRNLLGPQLSLALGGESELAAILSGNARIERLKNGALELTLGAEPTPGDVNRREIDSNRVALARFIHARGLLHVPRQVAYFEAVDGLSSLEAQEQWHLRFLDQ